MLVDYILVDPVASIDSSQIQTETEVSIDLENGTFETNEDNIAVISISDITTNTSGKSPNLKNIVQPVNGLVVVEKDSIIKYFPNADFNGSDSFTLNIEITDENNSVTETELTLDVVVNPLPDSVNDTLRVDALAEIGINVLNNDTYTNKNNVSISQTSTPSYGNTTINEDKSIIYSPVSESDGDTFTYTTIVENSDGSFTTEEASVVIIAGTNSSSSNAANAQGVSLQSYGAIGDGVTDDTAAIQAAFNAETNITSDPANTYLISGTLYLNQNMAQIIDFNNSTLITNTSFGSWFIDVDKRNYANTLTTIRNLDVNGNDQDVYGIDVASRVLFENIEIHNMIRDCVNGIRVLVYNTEGIYGQSVFDNVDIHDLVSATNDAVIGNCAGMVHAFLVSTSQLVTQDVQIVYKNSDVYNTWGEDAGGITINSPGIDTSNSPLSFWFENVTVSDAQRRTVKNFIGNTTWINCTFTSAANDNPKIISKANGGLDPAGLVSVGADSGALGATNNLFCGCTFEGSPDAPLDSWFVEVILIGSLGPASMEIRNSTFTESGLNGRWAPMNGITAYGQIQDLTIQNTIFATTKKIRALGTPSGTFLLDSNNTYADGKTTTLEHTNMPYTESNMAFEPCPSIDD